MNLQAVFLSNRCFSQPSKTKSQFASSREPQVRTLVYVDEQPGWFCGRSIYAVANKIV